MNELFPNFLRGLVSATMNILLMLSLLQPKYGKKITNRIMVGITVVNMIISIFCYINGNLTLLTRVGIIVLTILCFLIRPLFRDSFMQWLFSYITAINIHMCVMVLSFSFSRIMPYPIYANTLIRLILIMGIIFLIRKYMHPLYRQMVTYWNIFFYMALVIFINFVYYFTVGDDVVQTLVEQAVPIHLLVLITVAVYVSIFYSIKTISNEYELREENLRMKNNQELLYVSASAMEDRITLLDKAQHQSSITAHDRRHFNNTLLELLEQKKTEDVIAVLRQQSSIQTYKVKNYCENTVVNAAVSYYVGQAKEKDIITKVNLDIPNTLTVDSLELAMVISNLLENAVEACEKLENDGERIINLTCRYVGRLVLEISNPCDTSTVLDEKGYPFTQKNGHGIGTKSVLVFAEAYNAEVFYQIIESIFRVRMLI